MDAFMERPEETLNRLGTEKEKGLTDYQAEVNRKVYGANIFTKEKPVRTGKRILKAASEPMIIMLLTAAFLTLGVNIARYAAGGRADFLECAGIFAAISLSVAITVVMEGRSARAFEALSKIGEDTAVRVIRNGTVSLILHKEVVAGDILYVATGDKLPADGRLLESNDLTVDESALTGESMPVRKSAAAVFENPHTPVTERANVLYSGCYVTGGNGKIVVTGVGDHTEFGKIAQELAAQGGGTTPLQEKMAALGKKITILGTAAAAIVFIIQIVIFLVNRTASLDTVSEAFITSIVLIVAAVPEGLPTIVAVSLAVNIIKMSKQNALVKKMIACETVGCINVVCSDKTGTLTENRMTVTDIYSHRRLLKPSELKNMNFPSENGADDPAVNSESSRPDTYVIKLLENFCINSTADIQAEGEQIKFIGNPTECALLSLVHQIGWSYDEIRKKSHVTHVYPFCSENEYMTIAVKREDGIEVFVKGSPEKVLSILSGFAAPFSALQLLWINIIMDGPPALTLGLEPIREDLMKRRPTPRNSGIVSKPMLVRIVINAGFISFVFMAQHLFNFLGASPEEASTVLFTLFVVFQIFNALNSRELTDMSIFKNIRNNRLMLSVFTGTLALQIIITQFGGPFFGTVPLSFEMWIKITGAAFSVVIISEIIKLIKRVY